ncbi:MAG: hypothetical protein IJT94_08510 [Oscillibacter sp.]|nr:hypothetical protein [Oscillibacter sp.]
MKVIRMPENGVNFVPYEVEGTMISFGDEEIMMNLKKKEKDDDVTVDVCRDYLGGLTFSTGGADTYVAQIHIPARKYTDTQTSNPDYNPEDPASPENITERRPVPFSMKNVTLTLYEEVR